MIPDVSIVIPVYNVQNYIRRCLDSVLQQTYLNLEIIIVNDGSTDNSYAICQEYVQKDNRIQLIHKKNEGVAVARNTGLDKAIGKYIYFCDPDDWVDERLIEENLELAKGTNADIVLFGFYVHLNNNIDRVCYNKAVINSRDKFKALFYDVFLKVKYGNGFVWNKLYSKKFLDKYGFRFEKLMIQQDEVFNMQLYPRINTIVISDKPYYHYVQYESGNASTRYIQNKFNIIKTVYKKFLWLYKEMEINDTRYLTFISNRFYHGVINCVTVNLFHSNCKLSLTEKKKVIEDIITDTTVIKYANENDASSLKLLRFKIVYFLMKTQNVRLLILYNLFYNFIYKNYKIVREI